DYNKSTMRNPDYVSMLTRDLYIEPVSVEAPADAAEARPLHIPKGGSAALGAYELTFTGFEMQQHANESMMSGGAMGIGAVLRLKLGQKTETITLTSFFDKGAVSETRPHRVNDTLELRFTGMNIGMENGAVSTAIFTAANPNVPAVSSVESLVVEASMKPHISLVWIGSFLIMAGAAVAMVRRRKELYAESGVEEPSTKRKRKSGSAVNAL
ncbi:MAG TPA: hypothetical protein VGA55_03715, partial [Bacteroidota bacterium]